MEQERTMIFVISVLYSLPEKWRGVENCQSFENIIRNTYGVSLHTAWFQIKKEGLLKEFSDQFYFDHLYGISNLATILAEALRSRLIRLGGSDLAYHLDEISFSFVGELAQQQEISADQIKCIAERLNTLLEEQETAHLPSPAKK